MSEMDHENTTPGIGDDPKGADAGRARAVLIGASVIAVGIVALLAILSSTGGSDSAASNSTDTATSTAGSGVQGLPFVNEDGSEGTLADYEGEPLVVNFFASWCGPCRAELPDFQAVHVEADDKVQFVGVNHDVDDSSWLSFVEETQITYPTVFQPNQELFNFLDLFGMPSTVFIDADGEVIHRFSGIMDDETLRSLIDEHLGVEV